ncbi:MAG: PQQ-dependent sugar dehydrogenase [Acidobacteria bacterium]|nr:PQQ-dependent sugar dehydrogenase [Acidobacteriota bacterium]
MDFRRWTLATTALLALQIAAAAAAIDLQPVVTGLSRPVFVTSARDGTGRLFIVEQDGLVKVVQPGSATPTVFVDLSDRVETSGGEQGLLGLAFHPDFAVNGLLFVNYTRKGDGRTIVESHRVSPSDPNVGRRKSHRVISIPQPASNHNGGMLAFGPDGFLYVGMGDGGFANDPGARAQDLHTLLGKMLRIDVDRHSGSKAYGIPGDNPFVAIRGAHEIWAFGLRNPWRWSFDRVTGDLWAGDVGQDSREEIDLVTRGGNYGWRVMEGDECTGIEPARCGDPSFIAPVETYDHAGGRCAVTGGYAYRGTAGTFTDGAYLFGDFCTGEIFLLEGGPRQLVLDTALNISSFGEDENGEILVVDYGGTIYRLVDVP